MRVGLFGGSFDPVHRGHVASAEAARVALALERVELVVTGRPPHKAENRRAPALARYAMVELALLDRDELVASTVELDETRPSYTIDTLEARRRQRPEDEVWLLVGADSLAGLHTWRRFEAILDGFPLGVLARPGFERDGLLAALDARLAAALARAQISWIDNPPIDLSSRAIRGRLARGEAPPEGALAPPVLRFAQKYRLYR